MAAAKRLPDFRSCSVALLELLARAAPARVVAAELLVLVLHDLLGVDLLCRSGDGARGRHRRTTDSGSRDRARARCGLVLVREPIAVLLTGLLEQLGVLRRQLRVEERADDLLADLEAELLEHAVPLAAVLDERVLLRERAQVNALTQVVHVLEVLAPAGVDDLERHVALEVAHQLDAELLLLVAVGVACVLLELLDERVALERDLFFQLLRGDVGAVEVVHRLRERAEVPLLPVLRLRVRVDGVLDDSVDPAADLLRHVLAIEHATALRVHHVVVLEDVLAHHEVLLFDLLLRVLDLLGEDRRLHRLVVGHLEPLHDVLDPVAREQAHELVLAGEGEARLAGVALAARAAAKLVVDAARLVALGAEHVEAAGLTHAVAELDVDAAARHVRRDRDRAELACVLDDLRLALVLLRVQDVVLDPLALEQLRDVLRRLDRDRPEQNRLARGVALLDVADHRLELAFLRAENEIVLVLTRDVDVGRDLDDVQVVDLDELLLLGLRGAGHAGELLVEAEVVLERDRGERDVLFLDLQPFLRLDRLVQAFAPAPALHDPAGVLVDDLHLAVLDHVVDFALVERLRLERLSQVVDELDVPRVVEVVDLERALDLLDRVLAGRDGLELLVVDEVAALRELVLALGEDLGGPRLQRLHDAREVVVRAGRGLRLAGDDQRCARLVDQDRVDLVHDCVAVAALHELGQRDRHVVAQVVEAELRVRPVRDVGGVGLLALRERHLVLDERGAHPELVEDGADPLRVALGQIVVNRHEVDALALERVQVQRLDGDERLALTGLHLGDVALVQGDAAHQLDVEESDADRAPEGLPDRRKGLEEELLERLSALQALLELPGLAGERLVGELLELGLERPDVGGLIGQPLEAPSFAEAEDLLEGTQVLGHAG